MKKIKIFGRLSGITISLRIIFCNITFEIRNGEFPIHELKY